DHDGRSARARIGYPDPCAKGQSPVRSGEAVGTKPLAARCASTVAILRGIHDTAPTPTRRGIRGAEQAAGTNHHCEDQFPVHPTVSPFVRPPQRVQATKVPVECVLLYLKCRPRAVPGAIYPRLAVVWVAIGTVVRAVRGPVIQLESNNLS